MCLFGLLPCFWKPHSLSRTTLPRLGRLVWASAQLEMHERLYGSARRGSSALFKFFWGNTQKQELRPAGTVLECVDVLGHALALRYPAKREPLGPCLSVVCSGAPKKP